jgi:type I restriction enzyme S subunit
MIEESKLPKGWEVKKLGEVCDKMSNGANVKQSDEKIGLPISRIETIWNEVIDLKRVKYVSEYTDDFKEKYTLKKGDILFSHINSDLHLGKAAIYKCQPEILIHGINLLLIRVKDADVLSDFLSYQFKFKRSAGEFINIAQKSVNQSSINQSKLKNLDIVIPPLAEQQKIVTKIEELFSQLENGKQQLLTAQKQLKTYRQSLLKSAFEGKLTNPNLKAGELPKGWEVKKLGEVCKFSQGVQVDVELQSFEKKSGWVRFLRIVDFTKNNEPLRFVKNSSDRYFLKKDEIAMVRYGTVGFVCTGKEGVIANNLFKITPVDVFEVKYLIHFFQSDIFKRRLKTKGATMQALSFGSISPITIPVPPLFEQERIVAILESKLTICDKIEETIKTSLQQSETLRQSILKKAFEGRLV